MTGKPSIDELLAPDTDEESIAISDEEFSHLLDDKEEGELSETSTVIDDAVEFLLDEELDYEPPDDHDLIVNVTAEDMFESEDETVQSSMHVAKLVTKIDMSEAKVEPSEHNPSEVKVKKVNPIVYSDPATKQEVVDRNLNITHSAPVASVSSYLPPPGLPSTLLSRVRERLSSPSPAMVCWHKAHIMKEVVRGLDMSTSIHSWHLFHAWSKEKSKMSMSDRFKEMQTVEEVENADAVSRCGGGVGGGQLSTRFGYLAVEAAGRVREGGKRKSEEELPENMRNKIMRRLGGKQGQGEASRRERFGEVDQNFFDNVKYLSDKWRR